jgi:hypothetical protein
MRSLALTLGFAGALALASACSNPPATFPTFNDDATPGGMHADAGNTGMGGGRDALPVQMGQDGAAPPVDTGVTPPNDSGTPPNDSGMAPADSGTPPDDSGMAPDDSGTPPNDSGTPPDDSGQPPADSGMPPADSGAGSTDDGTPTRQMCTGNFGNGLSTGFGRMDGYLVSIVPPGGPRTCNGDGHVHLQVLIMGSVYDVAVNVDTYQLQRDMAPPGAPWTEGWSQNVTNDYVSLGLHNTDFMQVSDAAGSIESFLANANHITVYGTGYGPTGAHDIHRHFGNDDGMLVIDPLSPTAHIMFFCFNNQTF